MFKKTMMKEENIGLLIIKLVTYNKAKIYRIETYTVSERYISAHLV